MAQALSMVNSQGSQLYHAGGALIQSKTKVMITGLPPTMTNEDLKELFCTYSNSDSDVVRCEINGNGTGYAIFENEEAANSAIKANICIGETPLKMRFAMRMTDNEQASLFMSQSGSKFAKSKRLFTNGNDINVNMIHLPPMQNDTTVSTGRRNGYNHSSTTSSSSIGSNYNGNGYNVYYFGGGRAAQGTSFSFSDNGLSIHVRDDIDATFGNSIPYYQRKQNIRNLRSHVMSRYDAYGMIDTFIGPKERYTLILGELDFSFALSIVGTLGDGHNVISTSLDTYDDTRKYRFSTQNAISRNVNNIRKFYTGYNGKKSIVFRGFNGLKLRESLIKEMGKDVGSVIAFDKILFAMPFAAGSNHFDIRNLVFLKKLFQNVNDVVNRCSDIKPEIHLLMPIFATRSQFESYKIEEIGKKCNLKWRLKTVKIFDWNKLDIAFKGCILRSNYGRVLNNRYYNNYSEFNYMGYYILETI